MAATKSVSRRLIATLLIVVIIVAVSATSTYMLINTQRSNQLNAMIVAYLMYTSPSLRIVSQAPSITEIIFGLGLEDYLVGCTEYCDYPPKLQQMIASGKVYNKLNWWSPSLEAIIAIKPSIVLLDGGVGSHNVLAGKLLEQGIPFLILQRGNSIDQIESTILQLGSYFSPATNSRSAEAAQKLVNAMREKISTVSQAISGQTKVKVLVCVWLDIDNNMIYTVGRPTFLNEIIELAGGINIYGNLNEAWPTDSLTLERAQYNDPNVIVILDHHAFLNPTETLQKMGGSPLGNTPAYPHNVFFLQGQAENLFSRPGPRVAEGVELLAHILFPDVFNVTLPDSHVINSANYKEYLSSLILEQSAGSSSGRSVLQPLPPQVFVPLVPPTRHPLFSFFFGGVVVECGWA
ncbi:MAG: ABC transporter substrate-binding protein [Candidatus Freyarchaeota archaeon]|nr:ABC transporter substrate-binding protein [Candidatus Jordarchaeia archaeon]